MTIDHDSSDPMAILGLSMAAQAQAVTDPAEIAKALLMLPRKYPDYSAFPMPKPQETIVFRVLPQAISVLDYRKRFGHAELVIVLPDQKDILKLYRLFYGDLALLSNRLL